MAEEGVSIATSIPSFLIESLVWNVSSDGFGHTTYREDLRFVIADLWNNSRKWDNCCGWKEINGRKYLFTDRQAWTREQANDFLDAAWQHVGFQ